MTARHVALLRGINVGKAKRIAMADLRVIFASLGCRDVATLLNSGNVVFVPPKKKTPERLAEDATAAIFKVTGVASRVTILTPEEFGEVVRGEPFGDAVRADASRLFVGVFAKRADRSKALAVLAQDFEPERVELGERALYLHCPRGVADSRAMKAVEKAFRGEITSRNWATIVKLQALV